MRRRGFTLTELMVVVALAALILGLVTFAGRRASAARTLDAAAREVEAALKYARQAAPNNSNGAKVVFVAPTDADEGTWTVQIGSKVEKRGTLSRDVRLTLSPAATEVAFGSSGAPTAQRTVTVNSPVTGGSVSIQVHAVTGAVQRL